MRNINNKVENQNKKNNFKNIIKFYNENIKRKHLSCFIVSLVLFGIFFTLIINNQNDFKNIIEQGKNVNRFTNLFNEKIPLVALIVFSGITPYIYIPVIGLIGVSYKLAINICNLHIVNMIFTSILGIMEIFFYSLAVALGIYLCNMTTKKFRYDQKVGFSFADVKQRFLELTKSKKLKEYKEKRLKKNLEFEKLNVKIDYKNVIVLTIISIIFVSVFTLISGV